MNLFDLGKRLIIPSEKKDTEKKDSKGIVLAEYTFIQPNSFRGFKAVRLSTYGYEPVANGIRELRQKNPKFTTLDGDEPPYVFRLTGRRITIQRYKYDTGKEDELLQIYVDDNQIGTCFHTNLMYSDLVKLLAKNRIEKVYVLIETLKEFDTKKDKIIFADDYKSTLFIKVKQ